MQTTRVDIPQFLIDARAEETAASYIATLPRRVVARAAAVYLEHADWSRRSGLDTVISREAAALSEALIRLADLSAAEMALAFEDTEAPSELAREVAL